nr:trypsin 5G1-like isoform X1 [Danaus plexippus plexippus]
MIIFICVCIVVSSEITFVIGILGGRDVTIDRVPHHVSYGDICGGVLVHRKWALTVAHCGTDKDYIRVGSRYRLKGVQIKIKKHLIHPLYQKEHSFDFDVQLLGLFRGLNFGKTIKDIEISDGGCDKYIDMSGWGYGEERGDYNHILQQVRIKLVVFELCQMVDQPWYNGTLTGRMFCAGGGRGGGPDGGGDACQGDSGGGAVSKNRLVGLSSFGYGCGRGVPGVYVNVSNPGIISWIRQYTVR